MTCAFTRFRPSHCKFSYSISGKIVLKRAAPSEHGFSDHSYIPSRTVTCCCLARSAKSTLIQCNPSNVPRSFQKAFRPGGALGASQHVWHRGCHPSPAGLDSACTDSILHSRARCRASCADSDSVDETHGIPSNVGWIPSQQPRSSKPNWPNYVLSREEAVQTQLQALQRNDEPHKDFGVEVLYRFANIDLLSYSTLSRYFGRTLDLGRFELFRLSFNEPPFALLIDHAESTIRSALQVDEDRWMQRVGITSQLGEKATFEFTMTRRVGGRFDGFWFTDSLIFCNEATKLQ